MGTKLYLCSHDVENDAHMAELSRKKVFPGYVNKLAIQKVDKLMRNRGSLINEKVEELQRQKNELQKTVVKHSPLFKNYLEASLNGDHSIVKDLLELVESHYMPRVSSEQET